MASKFIIVLLVIGLVFVSGCARLDSDDSDRLRLVDSKMKCDDGRIVSISEGYDFKYDFFLKYDYGGSWGISGYIQIDGDGTFFMEESKPFEVDGIEEISGKLTKDEMNNLINLVNNKFFDLPAEMLNYETCMDGSTTSIYVELNGVEKTVKEYCSFDQGYMEIVSMISDLTADGEKKIIPPLKLSSENIPDNVLERYTEIKEKYKDSLGFSLKSCSNSKDIIYEISGNGGFSGVNIYFNSNGEFIWEETWSDMVVLYDDVNKKQVPPIDLESYDKCTVLIDDQNNETFT